MYNKTFVNKNNKYLETIDYIKFIEILNITPSKALDKIFPHLFEGKIYKSKDLITFEKLY